MEMFALLFPPLTWLGIILFIGYNTPTCCYENLFEDLQEQEYSKGESNE